MIGYLDSSAGAGETTYIHFRVSRARRPKSAEGDPSPIGRKLCFRTRCVGCLRMVPEVKNVQLRRNTVLKIHVDEKTPIRRPIIGNQKIGRRQSLQFAGTIRSSNVDVLRSSGIIDFISHPFAVRRENRKYFGPPIRDAGACTSGKIVNMDVVLAVVFLVGGDCEQSAIAGESRIAIAGSG